MTKPERKPRNSADKFNQLAEEYFANCKAGDVHPSLPGLALAFGLEDRRELERLAAGDGKAARAVRRAITRVEEANIQSAYRKDTAASAKFILQNGFGYSEKSGSQAPEEISVTIVDAADGDGQ